MNAKFKIIK